MSSSATARTHLWLAGLGYLVFVVYGSLVPLDFRPMSPDEMLRASLLSPDAEMRQVYAELYAKADELPGREELGSEWTLALADGTAAGGVCFKGAPDADAAERVSAEILTVSAHFSSFVCVCDAVWSDGAVYDEWTERYRRGLAAVCRTLAAQFDVVAEITAGLPVLWKGKKLYETIL